MIINYRDKIIEVNTESVIKSHRRSSKKHHGCRSAGSSHSTPKVLMEKIGGDDNAEEFKNVDDDGESETSDLADDKKSGDEK